MHILLSFNMYVYTHLLSFEVHHPLSISVELLLSCIAKSLGNYFS